MKNEIKHWMRVFSNWKYIISALVISFLFYAINVFIANYRALIDFSSSFSFFGSLKFFFSLMMGFKDAIKFSSFISLIIISLMLGILFSLVFYKLVVLKGKEDKKTGFISSIGVLLGAFAPGCAACGIGLASVLGFGGAFLAAFPLGGLEFSLIAIIMLSIAIFKTSNSSCNIMLDKKMKGGSRK